MFEIAVISGKGGTGKTTVSGALAYLLPDLVKVDADVDASNLHLLLSPKTQASEVFYGAKVAKIDSERCSACGRCDNLCRYEAIDWKEGRYHVNPYLCEGCNACVVGCPEEAIGLFEEKTADLLTSQPERGAPLFHADMEIGAEGSGKLISRLRQKAKGSGGERYLIDSSPGVACSVMSAITGADFVVIVTEPTLSGARDFQRVWGIVEHFKLKAGLIVNKFDLNPSLSDKIEQKAREYSIKILGRIPYDPAVARAVNRLKPVVAFDPASPASRALVEVTDHLRATVEEIYGERALFVFHK